MKYLDKSLLSKLSIFIVLLGLTTFVLYNPSTASYKTRVKVSTVNLEITPYQTVEDETIEENVPVDENETTQENNTTEETLDGGVDNNTGEEDNNNTEETPISNSISDTTNDIETVQNN